MVAIDEKCTPRKADNSGPQSPLVRGGKGFKQVEPGGDITRFSQRWYWITHGGIVQPFEHASLQQRRAWVKENFWQRVEEFSP